MLLTRRGCWLGWRLPPVRDHVPQVFACDKSLSTWASADCLSLHYASVLPGLPSSFSFYVY